MMFMLYILLCLYITASTGVRKNPIVSTVYGKVRGESLKSFSQNDFFSFQGIPFAEPPVGALRFQPPQPPKKWDNILYKQNADKRCVESHADFQPGEGEDCLYLNVYTPQIPNNRQNVSLPVLVFIHGGAFVFGRNSIKEHKPHKLMDYGIVMVTIQYRLGLFGFLSTGDLECPGNNGFKDQQFALRWIQANIRNFGGDPTKVTISGESAGSSSVGYHLLGTNSDGLFRGAIQASGSPLGSWCLQRNPKANAYKIANYIDPKINETNTSTKDLVNLFRTLDVPSVKKIGDALYNKEPSILAFNSAEGFIYMGVIEPEHDGAFLTENAFKKFESGNFNLVPTFIGITSEESRNLVKESAIQEILSRYDASPELTVTPSMEVTDENIKIEVGKEIKKFYVGDRLFNESQGPSLKFMSDAGFGRSIIKQAQMQADYSDVYFYEFGYSGDVIRTQKTIEYIPGAESVGHTEDVAYVFLEISEDPKIYSKRDILTINRMVLLWTNFVKYLNPTPEPEEILQNVIWPKLSKNSFPYFLINDTLEVKYDLKKSMMDKYHNLFDLYAVSPLHTY